ncbi:MAG TPA: hypothetical protein VFO07_13090 [Roseiflexaceae bacterium]|nr:hypothetical protein [Roseiflexaceae bacterium]
MGDISRHRDIYINTRDAIPTSLLDKCKLSVAELTYLELGNYLTDVAQFRDPVMYIFAKQRIWRDFILPKAGDKALTARVLAALAGAAGLAASQLLKDRLSGIPSDVAKYGGPLLAGLGTIFATLPTDTYADIGGADEWIDRMFGTPIERTTGDLKKRDEKHYGYVGQFFRYFIEGITHLLFAEEIQNKVKGDWGKIGRISEKHITTVFNEFYTQYYPHEHTDQPPYVWDASERPKDPRHRYEPSKRQRNLVDKDIGVMNIVDVDYVQYLSEGLADLEHDWRAVKPGDTEARHRMLVRMGKLLHGVEDWFFHSNVVELLRLRSHTPAQGTAETSEDFLKRFVRETASKDPEFAKADTTERLRLQRRLYRRLRYPNYERGDRVQSGGILSKTKPSILSLHHAYPAFPSQQDTAHTLLHALENLERKATHPSGGGSQEIPPWAPCVIQKLVAAKGGDGEKLLEEKAKARGVSKATVLAALIAPGGPAGDSVKAVVIDVLREWLPLVVTLLSESERQRLVANVDPLQWPVGGGAGKPQKASPGDQELNKQLERHKQALKPKKNEEGFAENNYERAARYLVDCGFLNKPGQQALVAAFAVDQKSQQLLEGAPGCGGFLIQFAVDLQTALDQGDAATAELNKKQSSIFDQASDNSAFNEIIGSHSLMSKDTLASPPFFAEAKVLASLASSSVFHIMLEQISAPAGDRRLPWKAILHHLIRYPVAAGGWERRAMDFFRKNGRIPKYTDLPELARLVELALRSPEALKPWHKGTKDDELKEEYIRLETKVSQYRYP